MNERLDFGKDYEGGKITVWGTWKGKSSMEKTMRGVRSLSGVRERGFRP